MPPSQEYPQNNPYTPPVSPQPGGDDTYPGKTLGIVGLVLSFIIPLLGLILSAVALGQSKKNGRQNTPALVGVILGAIFTVIGLLMAALMFSTFSNVQMRARDSERQTDINAIAAQADAYYANNGTYPQNLEKIKAAAGSNPDIFVGPNGETYAYEPQPAGCTDNCSSYRLSAELENGTTYTKEGQPKSFVPSAESQQPREN